MADHAEPENPQGPTESTQATADPAHVFISYASPDSAAASALVEDLERHGIACWIAPRDVDAGALYADAIVRAISRARAFVLLLSEGSIDSSHVGKEVERASAKSRPIIALRIDTAPLTPALEYFLSESQWIEVADGGLEAVSDPLSRAVRSLGNAKRDGGPTFIRESPATKPPGPTPAPPTRL